MTQVLLLHTPLQQSAAWRQPEPGCTQPLASVGNGFASAGAPPLEELLLEPAPDDVPLDVPLLDAPLDVASPPSPDDVPPELVPLPLLPLLDIVASVEPSSAVASPLLLPPDEPDEGETPLDETAPDELPSAPPSVLPSAPVRDPVLLLLPHPAAVIAIARAAMQARGDR